MSNFKKSNTQTMEEVHKKNIHIMRFTHIDINFNIKYAHLKPIRFMEDLSLLH